MKATVATANAEGKSVTVRYASIDVFRGLTMAVMIFVNDLDGVRGLPWWTHHAKAEVDVMTYVDMVFPFFLFVLGLSMPIAIAQRLKKNASVSLLWLHVLERSGSLIVLGLILANVELADSSLMGIDRNAWAILALLGSAIFLYVPLQGSRQGKSYLWLRVAGAVLTIAMFVIFRRVSPGGHVGWIVGSYPEILGFLGYTYLAVALLYIPTRCWTSAPMIWFVLVLAFSVCCASKWIVFPRSVPLYFWPFGDGTMVFVAMAGVVTAVLLFGELRWKKQRERLMIAFGFALATIIAAKLLTPLGISKIRDTPTWGLYSVGAAVLLIATLYWICDLKKQTTWAAFFRPAGSNTLLTYLLPDFYYFISWLVGFEYFATHFNSGWPGVLRSALFTVLILAIAGVLTRLKVRLQL